MLVDNGIVVSRNIFRHREEGSLADDAARDGAKEVALAIIASTLTTVAVFLPIVFVEGLRLSCSLTCRKRSPSPCSPPSCFPSPWCR